MNKGYIFDSLKAGILSAGFSEKEVNLHIQHYTEKFAGMSDDALAIDMERHGGVDGFVTGVIDNRNQILLKDTAYRDAVGITENGTEKPEDLPTAESEPPEPTAEPEKIDEPVSEDEPIKEDEPIIEDEPIKEDEPITEDESVISETPFIPPDEDPMGVYDLFVNPEPETVSNADSPIETLFGDEPEAENDGEPEQEKAVESEQTATEEAEPVTDTPTAEDGDIRTAIPENNAPLPFDDHTKQVPVSGGDTVIVDDALVLEKTEEELEPEDNTRHSALRDRTYFGTFDPEKLKSFRLKAALLSPFTGLAALLSVSGVFLLYLVSVLLIPLFLIIMLAVCAAGIVVSLVGIIYGVSQIFTVKPVGLYEIGLGLVVLGVTIAVSVLLYNFAVQLLPRLVKRMWSLVQTVFFYIVDLYCYKRGEASKP